MSSQVVTQSFRAVQCRYCGKPVRVPEMVSKRESDLQGETTDGASKFMLVSRVFNVRCRCCERESVYSINQIVDGSLLPKLVPGECRAATS